MKQSTNKKVINATKVSIYKSKFEDRCAQIFASAGIAFEYEKHTYTLQDEFKMPEDFVDFGITRHQKKVKAITYTPDFVFSMGGHTYIIECKGFALKDFDLKKKLFLNLIKDDVDISYYIVHNVTEIKNMLNHIF